MGCLSLHVQSSCTQTPAQHFRATLVVFMEGQQLLLMYVHEGQNQKLPPTAPEQVFHLLSVLIAEALEMIFMVAKHSNAAIAEMVRPCPSWKCFAAHCTVPLKGTRALWVQLWSLDPALNAQSHHQVTSVASAGV